MNTNKKGHQFPAGISSPHLTYQRMLITLTGSLKIAILLLFLSSCGSMKINGIEVKGSHRKAMSGKDKAIIGFSALAGFALGTHFKEDIKKIKR